MREALPDYDHLKIADPDRAFCAMFAPMALRSDVFVLLALHQEWHAVAAKVTEPMLGLIRLTWWREALESLFGLSAKPLPPHPLLQALQQSAARVQFEPSLFFDTLKACEADLYSDPPDDTATLERYAQHRSGCLHLAMLQVLVADASPLLQKAVSHVATAYGMVEIIRDLPGQLARGKNPLPNDRAAHYGFQAQHYGTEQSAQQAAQMVLELVGLSNKHLADAALALRDVPSALRKQAAPVLLPALFAKHALRNMAKLQGDVLRHPIPPRGLLLTLGAMNAAKTGNF